MSRRAEFFRACAIATQTLCHLIKKFLAVFPGEQFNAEVLGNLSFYLRGGFIFFCTRRRYFIPKPEPASSSMNGENPLVACNDPPVPRTISEQHKERASRQNDECNNLSIRKRLESSTGLNQTIENAGTHDSGEKKESQRGEYRKFDTPHPHRLIVFKSAFRAAVVSRERSQVVPATRADFDRAAVHRITPLRVASDRRCCRPRR